MTVLNATVRAAAEGMPEVNRRRLLLGAGATAATLAATSLPAEPADHPDAELFALGEELERQWLAENAVYGSTDVEELWDAAFDNTKSIVDRIEAIPATSIRGLKVKARAVTWCHRTGPTDEMLDMGNTTDMRLVAQIVRALRMLPEGGAA